jgi:hypothetical protein
MRWNRGRIASLILLLLTVAGMAAVYVVWPTAECLAPIRHFIDHAPALPISLVLAWMVLYVISGRNRTNGTKNL